MSDLSHQRIADAATVWLSKPFSSLVVQELATTSWPGYGKRKFILDVVGVTPNAGFIRIVECKASRSDFLRGREKLEIYKEFCHQLYVAAPRGLVSKDELPEGVGLLEVGEAGRARLKRWPQFPGSMDTPGNYVLILERILQKLVVTLWRPTPQDNLHEIAWKDWLASMEGKI